MSDGQVLHHVLSRDGLVLRLFSSLSVQWLQVRYVVQQRNNYQR